MKGQKQVSEAFRRGFTQAFERSEKLKTGEPLRDLLACGARISAQEMEVYEGAITASEIET